MKELQISDFKGFFGRKGYTFYTTGFYNLNLIGERTENSQSDKFDDILHVIYCAPDNRWKHHKFPITTDPGKHFLLNPMNIKGCAILIPGQYKSAYKIGKHKDYKALEQVKPMWYVRDNNKDTVLDFDLYRHPDLRKKHAFFENIKSNIHRASAIKTTLNVGMYSAACQVLQNKADFDVLLDLAEKQVLAGNGHAFTYTLVESRDFK